ncbi:hypothetical protein [Vibrio phage Va2]|nr:hypothetical protein [Vibrio phage Va2]
MSTSQGETQVAENEMATALPDNIQEFFPENVTEEDILEAIQGMNLGDYREMDYVYEQILSKISQVSQDRVTYFKLLSEFERYWVILAATDILSDMVIKDPGNGTPITVNMENEEYSKELKELFDTMNVSELIQDCLPDLILYGEYAYSIKSEPGHGIVSVDDPYVPGEITAMYRGGNPISYYRLPQVRSLRTGSNSGSSITNVMTGVREVPYNSIMYFQLHSTKKIKLRLDDESRKVVHSPQMKVGMSFFWPAIEQIQLLKFREVAEAAKDLSNLTRPTLVGVSVPSTDSGKKSAQFCQKFEKLLNSGVQDPTLKLSGSEGLINGLSRVMAGRYKCLPQFASGKGNANKLDLEDQIKDDSVSKEKIERNIDLICTILGIPPELLRNQERDKKENYKMYARLSKKVKAVQKSIIRTLKILCVHHLSVKYDDPDIAESDINIVLESATSIEDVDDAESLGYVIDNVRSVVDLADLIRRSGIMPADENGEYPSVLDPEELYKYVDQEFKSIGSKAGKIFFENFVNSSGGAKNE